MGIPSWIGYELGGRYKIEELLGQGGMSSVYRATDPNLRRTVAIKLIHNHLSNDEGFVRRFEEEAANVAQLSHPNIVQVYDFNHDGETYFMVLEFLAGETLQDHLRELRAQSMTPSLNEIKHVATEVAQAIGFAHARGMIHRDIKPANVMMRDDGRVMLMDFGIAKMIGQKGLTGTGNVIGTAQYIAPELIQGKQASPESDIYALGIMLYEMVSGQPPFDADSAMSTMMMHLNNPVPDLREVAPDVPLDLVEVIERSLQKDPAGRYSSAEEFIQAVQAVRGSSAARTVPHEPTTEPMYTGDAMQPTMIEDTGASDAAPLAATMQEPAPSRVEPSASSPAAPPPAQPPRSAPAREPAPEPARSKMSPIIPVAIVGGLVAIVLIAGVIGLGLLGLGGGGDDGTADPVADATPAEDGGGDAGAGAGGEDPTDEPMDEPTLEPTDEPTAEPTPTEAPTATPFPEPFVNITNVSFDGSNYIVEYDVYGVAPHDGTTGVQHIHFYWNNIDQTQAGSPGGGPWYLYYGPSPATVGPSTLSAKPADATAVCAIVVTAGHAYIADDTGTCWELDE